jgi:tRNA-guanine family transglycosylase
VTTPRKVSLCALCANPCDASVCVSWSPVWAHRFGTALVPAGLVKLKSARMATDTGPIDPTCECFVCKKYVACC